MLLLALPMLGVWVAGNPLEQYFQFPPQEQYVIPESFSWSVFIGIALGTLIVVTPFVLRSIKRGEAADPPVHDRPDGGAMQPLRFPGWGWAGLVLLAASWVLAWTRFEWFAPAQIFTFTPVWLGYIIIINAVTYWRTGHCMMINRTGYFLSLFLISAVFWWYFEYLNRFVQNWFYHGIEDLNAWTYFLYATPPFATVLPAVLGTYELLRSGTRYGVALDGFFPLRPAFPKAFFAVVFVLSCVGLFSVGIWPKYLFPLLWMAPLLIITSLQGVRGRRNLFSQVAEGHWRDLYLLAIASLICGFFWELWNVHSLAKWTYSISYVQRFHLFEMPILGYAGYLPFGLECAVIAELFLGRSTRKREG